MKIKVFLIIAIILSVPSSVWALNAVVHIPEKYMDVQAGDRLYFQLDVKYPENPTRVDLRLNYDITDEYGKKVAEAQALKAIETQSSFMEFIVLPDSTGSGRHKINIALKDYGDLSEEVGTSFRVNNKKMDRSTLYFIISMGSVFLLAILVAIDIARKARAKN